MDAVSPMAARFAWQKEWPVVAMLLLVGVIYLARITTLPLRGEETRRAMVAREILWSGDWVIPRQQGEPFLSRPPLGSYPIALAAMLFGDVTTLATRLPTGICTLLTCLLVYSYCRQFASPTASLGASLAYASMGQVLQLGQIAETEAIFTLLVASSLLIWHASYSRQCSPYLTWSVAYLFVGLGALAKGPQAPVYFSSAIGIYLLYRGDWRFLVHPSHVAGLGVLATVLGAWHIPFCWKLGWPAVRDVWAGDVGLRFVDQSWMTTLGHLFSFPVEVWLYLLPSSLLLLAYLHPQFLREVHIRHPWVIFIGIAIGVTFPTCWLVPGAKPRYFMPLYPCIATLIAPVTEALMAEKTSSWMRKLWQIHQRIVLVAIWASVGALILWAAVPDLPYPDLRCTPMSIAIITLVAAIATIGLVWLAKTFHASSLQWSFFATTAITGLMYSGVIVEVSANRSERAAAAVNQLRNELPPGTRLVSVGLVETMFTYHYGEPIQLVPSDHNRSLVKCDFDYFCTNETVGVHAPIPFAWQPIARISCDRWKRETPQRVVIVGRRLPQFATGQTVATSKD